MQKARNVLKNRCLVYTYNRLSRFEHLHTRFEIIIPSEGCVHAQLDRQRCEVYPGEMLVIFPGILHSFEPETQGCGTMITFYAENFPEKGDSLKEMLPTSPVVQIDKADGDVAYCLTRLKAMENSTPANDAVIGAYLTLLLSHLTPALGLVRSGAAASKDVLYQAMKYISENLARPLSLKETAHALGVNSYYLSHVLSERIHMGFRTYLNSMRIKTLRDFSFKVFAF